MTGDGLWAWCPKCPPPVRLDNYWEIVYCEAHCPSSGVDLAASPMFSHWLEAGGDENRAMCGFLHRGDTST